MYKIIVRRNKGICKKYYYEDMFMFRKWLGVHRNRFIDFDVIGYKLNCTCTPQDYRYVNSGPLEWQEYE